MRVGGFDVEVVSGGRFRLDGGGMFGVIPRVLWSRLHTPDERGRIALDTNCLLIRTGDEIMLIDTGNGTKLSAKEQDIFALDPADTLLGNLAAVAIQPEDITVVLLTHLHMDHVGGASLHIGGEPAAAFPNARYVAQRLEWEDAVANRSHMRVSYRPENLAPLQQSGRLELIDGDTEVIPGIRTHVTGGHTRAHQCVLVSSGGETLFYPADICPTRSHLRGPYNMAYDMAPYDSMMAKAELMARAAEENWLIAFDHEPEHRIVRLSREGEAKPITY
ncbi:MAG: MBL fold metallo-hydrolase [Actinomycetota bacterium]